MHRCNTDVKLAAKVHGTQLIGLKVDLRLAPKQDQQLVVLLLFQFKVILMLFEF